MPMYPNQSPLIRHSIEGRGIKLIRTLREKADGYGLQLLTRTRAKKILRAESGEVKGVVAETKDGDIIVGAKAVVIATGGYGGNKELLKKYYPHYHESMTYDPPRTNTGDGIVMATEVGAATAGLGCLNIHGPGFLPRSSADTCEIDGTLDAAGAPLKVTMMAMSVEPDTVWVNKNGSRYINEGYILQFFAYGYAVVRQPEGLSYTLYDSALLEQKEKEGIYGQPAPGWHPHDTYVCHIPLPGLVREMSRPHDKIKIADTWGEIAEWMGADKEALKATVEAYNAGCDQGLDAVFAKERKYLKPLRKPPFYAIEGHAMIADTVGGIKINEKMQVIDTGDRVIPGLFAAGTTTGEWEAETYDYKLTGHLVGFAVNSGRIAGESVMQYLE
jgi:fumarate reductase flavoprotein subunit